MPLRFMLDIYFFSIVCCIVTLDQSQVIFLIDKSEENTSIGPQEEEECRWAWLLDLERSVALAVGRCLSGMLQGSPLSLQEKVSEVWLSNVLFRNGLEMDFEQLGRKTCCWLFRFSHVQMLRKSLMQDLFCTILP